ncbi:unnamed protein product [Miscanthus lutarioriparius]|uniref:rRNA N-glycosylase n=1 Tax=Miscanthus lutarioriparius TaxID=422564 RepID=A0A811MXP2_9POAL|nr:unnamed protein product [Miscanthus lutarioriparius]
MEENPAFTAELDVSRGRLLGFSALVLLRYAPTTSASPATRALTGGGRAALLHRAAGLEPESVTLGKKDLEAAVGQLAAVGRRSNAGAGGSSQQDTARSLMVVAVMVCEAIRFRSVAGALAHIMCGAARFGPLPAHMVAQVKNWSSLSEYWLGAALYGQKFLPLVGAADGSQQRCDHIPAAPACACEDRLPGRHDGARRRAEPAEAAARQAQEGARRALARRVRPSTQQKKGNKFT